MWGDKPEVQSSKALSALRCPVYQGPITNQQRRFKRAKNSPIQNTFSQRLKTGRKGTGNKDAYCVISEAGLPSTVGMRFEGAPVTHWHGKQLGEGLVQLRRVLGAINHFKRIFTLFLMFCAYVSAGTLYLLGVCGSTKLLCCGPQLQSFLAL